MSKYWNEEIKNIIPYVPGEQPKDQKYIKLNTNENPYPPSPKVMEAIKKEACETLRLYPDPECIELRKEIAAMFKVNLKQVYIGNGSDEILAWAFMAFFKKDKAIIMADVSYSFYPVYAKMFDVKYISVPLDEKMKINIDDYNVENGGIIICNPNAPTGIYLSVSEIEKVVKNNPNSVVLIDEAYTDFGNESAVQLINKYPNLLIVRTFSKSFCLAGMRIGYVIGNEDLIEGLIRVKNSINSYTLDRLAIVAGIAAIKDVDYYNNIQEMIVETRKTTCDELKKLGFEVLESGANFVFVKHKKKKANEIFVTLKKEGILVRYFNLSRIDNYLRITIGTATQMKVLVNTLKNIL